VAHHLAFFAATLQFLLATTFLVVSVVAYRDGANAQRAAEAEVVKQGFPASILAQHSVTFEESGTELLLPLAIALILAALAALNLSGSEVGRVMSLILQPILLVGGGIVTARQVFAVSYLQSAFKKSIDTRIRDVNAKALVGAAMAAFPNWLGYLIATRFVLATAGSLLVIVLLVSGAR
jgi:hypothetical protein